MHFAQPIGSILTDMRMPIRDLDRAAPTELGECYSKPEVLRGRLLGKHDVLMGDEQGLTNGELLKSPRARNIVETYQFNSEIVRKTATMDVAERLGLGGQDLEFRGNFSAYLQTVGRKLPNEFSGNTRCGNADKYDHTRRIPHQGKYNGVGKRNDSRITFQICYLRNRRE